MAAADFSCPAENPEHIRKNAASATDLRSTLNRVTVAMVATRVTRRALLEAAELFHGFLNRL